MSAFDIDGFDGKVSVLNPTRQKSWELCGFKVGVGYKVLAVRDDTAHIKCGETLYVCHDFKKAASCSSGYEHLTIFVGRKDNKGNINNHVQYMNTVESLQKELDRYTLELDKTLALSQIANLRKRITEIEEQYELSEQKGC